MPLLRAVFADKILKNYIKKLVHGFRNKKDGISK